MRNYMYVTDTSVDGIVYKMKEKWKKKKEKKKTHSDAKAFSHNLP